MLEKTPYDFTTDPNGLVNWREIGEKAAANSPLALTLDTNLSRLEQINYVCEEVIKQFTDDIEIRRLSRDLYENGKPKNEAFAQRLFMVIAAAHCKYNDIDLSPESDRGAGPVDFKFSNGLDKVTVEIKLSTNSKVVGGYRKQLDAYTKAEEAQISHYVLIDVGRLAKKYEKLQEMRKNAPEAIKNKHLHYINGEVRPSASKL